MTTLKGRRSENFTISFDECPRMVNDKEAVMQNTYRLNKMLHRHSIPEGLRSQFVGTCLLALKNGLDYKTSSLTGAQIRGRIKSIVECILTNESERAEKLVLLNHNVLDSENVKNLSSDSLREILTEIQDKVLPFINDKHTFGQNLLNLFFVTFNKYAGKSDKNQAFTPDHIADFMAKIVGVNKQSVILDPCCGSGSFLVSAMAQALSDCSSALEEENVKKAQIFGIEIDKNAYGLATTNMLILSDGHSNVRRGSCFDLADWIKRIKPTAILMNPPYNGQRICLPGGYVSQWKKDKREDPSKGFYFVKFIADTLNSVKIKATLAALLPIACAIGTSGEIAEIKREILKENTLKAVFSLPNEIFYPGASASVCCMVFMTGKKHADNLPTYFGYYKDDGFKKRKNLGRIEQVDPYTGKSKWSQIEAKWIDTYKRNVTIDGFSAVQNVSAEDEWLCEAYMKTDYSKLTAQDFQNTINEYLAYLITENYEKIDFPFEADEQEWICPHCGQPVNRENIEKT